MGEVTSNLGVGIRVTDARASGSTVTVNETGVLLESGELQIGGAEIARNTADGVEVLDGDFSVRNSYIHNNTEVGPGIARSAYPAAGPNYDAMFVNAAGGDYHLVPNPGPLGDGIDELEVMSLAREDDFDVEGNPRWPCPTSAPSSTSPDQAARAAHSRAASSSGAMRPVIVRANMRRSPRSDQSGLPKVAGLFFSKAKCPIQARP